MRFTCLIALTGLLFGGCAKQQKIGALSEVAKGWCRTIRASQVIPVYPLTEDVQVGDLFVVQRPIEAEAQVYEEAGFLPLGIHLARLFPSHEYHNFYQDGAYGVVGTEVKANASQPSKVRSTDPALREVEARKYPPMVWQPSNGQEQPNQTEWAKAPRASFPSYGFRIQNSGGIDAALPIQGIPVGLTLLGAEEASASVTLADAFTYGLGTAELARYVRDWSTVSENREALKRYEPVYELDQQQNEYRIRYNFLRVVTRVYLVNRVNVSISDTSQVTGRGEVGNPRSMSLLAPWTRPADEYWTRLTTWNDGQVEPPRSRPRRSTSVAALRLRRSPGAR